MIDISRFRGNSATICTFANMLPILYQDAHLVAINKPHNLLVHRSRIAADERVFVLQLLRDQLEQWVSPCHRIDRKTAGVLLFALTPEADQALKKQFEQRQCHKTYWALVRGFVADTGTSNRPLETENGTLQEAVTHYRCLQKIEVPIAATHW
jgi:tRNA pseudouridine65 synthase